MLFFRFLNLGNRKILGTDAFCWIVKLLYKNTLKFEINLLFYIKVLCINNTLLVQHTLEIFAFKILIDLLIVIFWLVVLTFIKFLRHLLFPKFDQQYCKLHTAEVEYSAMEGKKGIRFLPRSGVCQKDAITASRGTGKPLQEAPSLQCEKWQNRAQCLQIKDVKWGLTKAS